MQKENRLKTCFNCKSFYQNNGHTVGIVQVCQPHFNIKPAINSGQDPRTSEAAEAGKVFVF